MDEALRGESSREGHAALDRLRGLDDAALIEEMKKGDSLAWFEFDSRFRPGLRAYGRRLRIPEWHRDEYVSEVVERVAMKLTESAGACRGSVANYLAAALRNHVVTMARNAARRDRRHQAASTSDGESVVRSACSESSLRNADALSDEPKQYAALPQALVIALESAVDDEEQQILAWVADEVPYRLIAEWIGLSYDATSKKIWRLLRRLRAVALRELEKMSSDERARLPIRLHASAFSRDSNSRDEK